MLLDGIGVKVHLDENGQDLAIEHHQDVESIIENNKRLQSVAQRSDWGRHVASIPVIFLQQWLDEEARRGNTQLRMFTPEFDALVDRKLKDPDWAFLRTDSAHVQSFMGFGS